MCYYCYVYLKLYLFGVFTLKFTKKILPLILVSVCVLSCTGLSGYAEESTTAAESTTQAVTDSNEKTPEELEQEKLNAQKTLEQQRAEIEAGLKESEEKLKKYGSDAQATEEYINALDEKIGLLNKELELLDSEIKASNARIAELDTQIGPLENEIEELQEKYDEAKVEYDALKDDFEVTYKAYCMRLRAMYISGNTSIIAALLSSKDISQFLSRYEMIRAVSKSDTELLKKINAEMDVLLSKQNGLDEQKEKLNSAKADLDAKKAEYTQQQDTVNKKQKELTDKKVVIASERANCDALFIEYASKNKIYVDFSDDSEDALAAIDSEIDALLSGKKSASEVTTAKNPELKDDSSVDVSSQTGEVFSYSDAALALGWPVPGHTTLSQAFGHVRYGTTGGTNRANCQRVDTRTVLWPVSRKGQQHERVEQKELAEDSRSVACRDCRRGSRACGFHRRLQ